MTRTGSFMQSPARPTPEPPEPVVAAVRSPGQSQRFEWLTGGRDFWARAQADISAAERRVLVQAMTFEGDAAGRAVADSIGVSGAADRRVLVDDYTRLVLSDRFRFSPALLDPGHREEVRQTGAMFRRLGDLGVGVRITNPVGLSPLRFLARNHKKLIVADDVAYIGGINFADHNFAWRDFMLRIEGRSEADFLAADFEASWEGRPRSARKAFPGLTLLALDGRNNARGFVPVLDLVAGARQAITVLSPYLTFPFTSSLAQARRSGVAVRLVVPALNNKPLVHDALTAFAHRSGVELFLAPGMCHFKAMLVDGRALVVGSSNLDFVSYESQEELVAVITDRPAIEGFGTHVLAAALAASEAQAHAPPTLAGRGAEAILWLARLAARGARLSRRGVAPWPARERALAPGLARRARRRRSWPGVRS